MRKDQILSLDNIVKAIGEFRDPSVLQPVVSAIEDVAKKSVRLQTAETLQLLLARDEIVAKFPQIQKGSDSLNIAGILRDEEKQLVDLFAELNVSKIKRIITELPTAFPETWSTIALNMYFRGNSKLVPEAARLLIEKGHSEEFGTAIDRAIREHSISSEALHWLCEERHGPFGELANNTRTIGAILSSLERDQFKDKRDRKLHDLLLSDQELVPDLIAESSDEELREAVRKLMLSPVFEELNKRSLLGRIVRIHPTLEAMLSGKEEEKQEALIVSWGSLERRKAEYDDLVTKKIPQNRQDISIARSYGDLRENFEYKSAKDQQRVLMRRKGEIERDLARSRGTDFAGVKGDKIEIGTIVELRRTKDGSPEGYTILGAWDTDPEKHIVSYLSQMAQALIGKVVGNRVNVPTETGEHEVEVVAIRPFVQA